MPYLCNKLIQPPMLLNDETLRFIRQHACDDVRALALHARPEPGVDLSAALTQIAGLQTLRAKVPAWASTEGILCPARLSLEQCSSEATARYKARLVAAYDGPRHRLADLTGGLGIDCSFLAPLFDEADYVERQASLCQLAAHNLPLLGLKHVRVHCADGIAFLADMPAADWIFLDPARRDSHGGRTVALADCEPDVSQLEGQLLERASRVLLKLSPMLDLTLALHTLRHASQAHIVAVGNECKELIVVLEKDAATAVDDIPVTCANLDPHGMPAQATFTFTRREEHAAPCPWAEAPATYLYEPNAALMKAGPFHRLAEAYGVKKLHPSSHLYTSEQRVEDFPGRTFHIEGWCGWGKKEAKALLDGLRQANLSVRNFPDNVAALRKRLRLAEGGDSYLFATTLADGSKALIRGKRVRD